MRPVTRDPVRVSADHRGGMPARVYQRSRRNAARDPAPSRLAFRLQRLWLTPMV